MRVIIEGRAVQFERCGAGRQVLILHGWADDSRSWRKFAYALADRYEVIVPDLPGFGASEAPLSAWGIEEYAAFVQAFIKKLGVSPYAIIGHSNGGTIAVHGVAHGTLCPAKLVLLASAGIRDEAKARKRLLRVVAKTGKLVTAPLPVPVRRKLRRALYRTAGSDMLVAEHMQETFKRVVAYDVLPDARCVDVPTLLLYGENDTSTPPRYGRLLAQAIPGARLTELPGTGHFLQLEAKTLVLRLVEEFLR